MIQVIFFKIELEISLFDSNTVFLVILTEKRVGKSTQELQRGEHAEVYLLTLKEQDKSKMELPLFMASKHTFCTSGCLTIYLGSCTPEIAFVASKFAVVNFLCALD